MPPSPDLSKYSEERALSTAVRTTDQHIHSRLHLKVEVSYQHISVGRHQRNILKPTHGGQPLDMPHPPPSTLHPPPSHCTHTHTHTHTHLMRWSSSKISPQPGTRGTDGQWSGTGETVQWLYISWYPGKHRSSSPALTIFGSLNCPPIDHCPLVHTTLYVS